MASKSRANEITRQIQNVRCHNWYIGKISYYISFERPFNADHFLLKDRDLKITQKINI